MKRAFRLSIPVMLTCAAVLGLFRFMANSALAAEKGVADQSVAIMGAFSQSSIQNTLDAFSVQTGFSTSYTQESNLNSALINCQTEGNCPDVAIVPNPGIIRDLADLGSIQPLGAIVSDFDSYYTSTYRTLGSVGDMLYAVPLGVNSKSMVWYRPEALDAVSATVPSNWTALLDLADTLVADGQTPFSIGAVSNGATGWPMTDIFENVLLRTAGPEVHRKLASHQIAWTDPVVIAALEKTSDILGVNEYQVGGITGTQTTHFMEAIDKVFSPSPSGAMYFGATWLVNFLGSQTPIDDYNYFDFPEIQPLHGKPFLGAGDFAIMFSENEEAISFIQFLATPQAGELWVSGSPGNISPNMGVDPNSYTNPILRNLAQDLVIADDYLFDLDDQLPSALQVYVWNAMMEFLAHQDQAEDILTGIELEAMKQQGGVHSVYLPLTRH